MIFALVMTAAAGAAAVIIWIYAGGLWGALAFAIVVWGLYKIATHQTGTGRPMRSSSLNAFQQPLSDD